MSSGRRKRFIALGDLLGGILEEVLPEDPELRSRLAAEAFLRLAGPLVAGHCRVLGLDGDILRVSVSTRRWQRELQRMGGDYLRQVNGVLPRPHCLAGIRFQCAQKKREP
jgi:hypothetical protein